MPSFKADILELMEFLRADYNAAGVAYKQTSETDAKAWRQREGWYYQDFYDNIRSRTS